MDPNWPMERDEAYRQDLNAGRNVACVGYDGRVSEGDEERVKHVAAIPLQKSLQHLAFAIERLDLDMVTKPQMKSFAPGTLDKADASDERTIVWSKLFLVERFQGGVCY